MTRRHTPGFWYQAKPRNGVEMMTIACRDCGRWIYCPKVGEQLHRCKGAVKRITTSMAEPM